MARIHELLKGKGVLGKLIDMADGQKPWEPKKEDQPKKKAA